MMTCKECMVEQNNVFSFSSASSFNNSHNTNKYNINSNNNKNNNSCNGSVPRPSRAWRRSYRLLSRHSIRFHALIFSIIKYNRTQNKYFTTSHKSLKRLRYLNSLNSKQKPR